MSRVKRQHTEWKKIFTNHVSDKDNIQNARKPLNSIVNKANNPIKNGQKIGIDISPKKTYKWTSMWKILITNHQGNVNQNHNTIPFYNCQDGYYQKNKIQQVLVSMWRNWNPWTLLGGMNIK